jgi:prepilin-type N-terminal cleavage/methylation domain-containing protein
MDSPPEPSFHRQPGFTLIEVVVVMLIFSVVIAMAAVITRGVTAAQKRALTATRMAAIDAALIQFVQQQRRLPCPADGKLVSGDPGAGKENGGAGGCNNNEQDGIVPYRSLGLSETDGTDGWDRRLTYRVDPALARNGAMDMSWCDPAGADTTGAPPGSCNSTPTVTLTATCPVAPCYTTPATFLTFLGGRGLEVHNLAGVKVMDPSAVPNIGAAYVLISHGESGGGAYLNSGTLQVSTVGDGTEELKNYASLPYTAGVTYYVDNATNDAADTNHFDDVVSRPSVMTVISRAALGPRAH